MKTKSVLPVFNAIAFICTIIVNYFAGTYKINGKTTGEISDQFDVLFKPAGYAFSIWGIIYLGLLLYIVNQLIPKQRGSNISKKIGILFIISCIANCAWLIVWQYEMFSLSVVIMFVLLLSLIGIYNRLQIGVKPALSVDSLFVHKPFSLYLGWISVATIANVTILLDYIKWDGFGQSPQTWFIIVSIVGLVLSLIMAFIRRDFVFSMVVLWAYTAVYQRHIENIEVKNIALVMAGFAVIPVIIGILRSFAFSSRNQLV